MKKAGTSTVISSPDAKPYRSPGAALAEADRKGVKPNFNVEEVEEVETPPTATKKPVELITPPNVNNGAQTAPEASDRVVEWEVQQNEDVEELRKENEYLKSELKDIKNAIILPQLREKYIGSIGFVKNFYYLVLAIKELSKAECIVFSKDSFSKEIIDIENWDDFNKSDKQIERAKALLGALLKNIPTMTSKFLN